MYIMRIFGKQPSVNLRVEQKGNISKDYLSWLRAKDGLNDSNILQYESKTCFSRMASTSINSLPFDKNIFEVIKLPNFSSIASVRGVLFRNFGPILYAKLLVKFVINQENVEKPNK